jgi:hypothetical protein
MGITIGVIQVNAQNECTSDLEERLQKSGVPYKHVTTISRVPYEVEIALQSSSNNDQLALEDNWFMQLARREATFTYRTSERLKSYKLVVFNTKDELIYSTQTYLYPEDLNQKLTTSRQTTIENAQAEKIIRGLLQFGELSPDKLNVISESTAEGSGQILIISVTATDISTANRSLPIFLDSLFQLLDTVNEKYGTYIVLCHLRLFDSGGNVLLDYVRDVEAGHTQWTSVSGLYNEWHSDPGKTEIPIPTTAPTSEPYPSPISDTSSNITPTQESANPYP